MNAIWFLSQPWAERLGWTLLHFLWQGVLIAAVYAGIRKCMARRSPAVRYVLACGAMGLLVVAPMITLVLMQQPAPLAQSMQSGRAVPAAAISHSAPVAISVVRGAAAAGAPALFLPWIVAFWMAGAMALSLRLAGGWAVAARMRTTMVRPAPPEWQQRLDALAVRIGQSRPVRLVVSGLVHVPGAAGWLRPVVLVPAGALTGLPAEHIEALLLHELAHIRRHDYLVNILQSIAEALLFYHPAVWWISGHLRTERELCCDDMAVSVSGDALLYACALAELESSRPLVLRTAMAANGGSLAYRIARLLGQPAPASQSYSGAGLAASAVLLGVAAFGLFGQATPRPKFEVVSIKPSDDQRSQSFSFMPGGRFTAISPMRLLIVNAYRLQPFQVLGGPGWMNTDRYTIEAKAEGEPTRQQMWLMVQSMLEDRFQMKSHRESRQLPIYALTPSRGGLKLQTKEGSCVAPESNTQGPGPGRGEIPPPPPGQAPCGKVMIMLTTTGSKLVGGKVPMSELTRVLAIVLGRQVTDKTGFAGTFDVNMAFSPDQTTAGLPGSGGPGDPGGPAPVADPASPSIFTAIQEHLGLRLEGTKGPVEVLVIDRIERPSEN